MDWDNVRAADIFEVMTSQLPQQLTAMVISVAIYPSEFGKERMAKEEMEGPPEDIFGDNKRTVRGAESSGEDSEEDDDEAIAKSLVKEDKGDDFDMNRLRKYQIERLRYYYAVIECDSAKTAKHIYDQCDGAEFEASANFFDLRFIPDDMEFDDDPT